MTYMVINMGAKWAVCYLWISVRNTGLLCRLALVGTASAQDDDDDDDNAIVIVHHGYSLLFYIVAPHSSTALAPSEATPEQEQWQLRSYFYSCPLDEHARSGVREKSAGPLLLVKT